MHGVKIGIIRIDAIPICKTISASLFQLSSPHSANAKIEKAITEPDLSES